MNDNKITALDIFSNLSADIHTEFKPILLGKPTSTSPRPIKIIYGSYDTVFSVISSYRIAKFKDLYLLPLISFVRDKTLLERQQLRTSNQEIDRRAAAEEHNLTITFKNGSLYVIGNYACSKNDNHVHRCSRVHSALSPLSS
jgi:hypothetical protein